MNGKGFFVRAAGLIVLAARVGVLLALVAVTSSLLAGPPAPPGGYQLSTPEGPGTTAPSGPTLAYANLIERLRERLTSYGPLTLGLAMLLGPLGVPLPTPLFALAAGAFVRQGSIHWVPTLFLALFGALAGDSLGYGAGHFARGWVERLFGRSAAWQKARRRFANNGGWAVCITRFLLTPLAAPTNLIAGGSGYGYRRFLVYDVAGTLIFLLLFGGLGYAFGPQWQIVGQSLGQYMGWVLGLAVAAIVLYLLLRRLWLRRRPQPAVPYARPKHLAGRVGRS
jgi:membrane protein DedA with SNARE-associated domain